MFCGYSTEQPKFFFRDLSGNKVEIPKHLERGEVPRVEKNFELYIRKLVDGRLLHRLGVRNEVGFDKPPVSPMKTLLGFLENLFIILPDALFHLLPYPHIVVGVSILVKHATRMLINQERLV